MGSALLCVLALGDCHLVEVLGEVALRDLVLVGTGHLLDERLTRDVTTVARLDLTPAGRRARLAEDHT